MLKSEIERGYTSRQARFKRNTLNLHLLIYDGEDKVEVYSKLMDQVGKELRKQMGLKLSKVDDYQQGDV